MGIFMHESRFPGHRSITRYCRVTPIITIWRKTWITQKDIPDAFTPIRATAENLQTCWPCCMVIIWKTGVCSEACMITNRKNFQGKQRDHHLYWMAVPAVWDCGSSPIFWSVYSGLLWDKWWHRKRCISFGNQAECRRRERFLSGWSVEGKSGSKRAVSDIIYMRRWTWWSALAGGGQSRGRDCLITGNRSLKPGILRQKTDLHKRNLRTGFIWRNQ